MNIIQECLGAMDIPIWVPRNQYRFIYQATGQQQWLVVCDAMSVDQWQFVKKTLANMMYFLGLKPGEYSIVTPAIEGGKNLSTLVELVGAEKIMSFGENVTIASDEKLSYFEICSLVEIMDNPQKKQQVLNDLHVIRN